MTVTDTNRVSVTVNGTPVTLDDNGQFTLTATNATQKIVATDRAGNKTEKTITIYGSHDYVRVTGVSLNESSLTLDVGGSQALTATVKPENAQNKDVRWASDNENAVTVSDDGLVTALAAGTANITVTTADGGFSAVCTVTVNAPVTEHTVIVTNDGNGEASASPEKAAAGMEITLTATPNAGYHFKEWKLISGGVSIEGGKFLMPDCNVEVKAIFEKDAPPAPAEYTITFDGNGGMPSVESMTTINQKLASLPDISRSKYSFDGWYTEKSGGTKVTTDTVFSENTTVYAHWTYTGGNGSSGGGGNSGGGGSSGGGSFFPTVEKPTITVDESQGRIDLSSDGSTAAITPKAGYEIDTVTVNGVDRGAVDKVTGLKTGDKLVVTFKAKAAFDVVKYTADLKLVARSSKTAKGNTKVVVKSVADVNGNAIELKELTDKGYTVKCKFYRSTRKASKYVGKVTKGLDDNSYVNLKGKKGTKYYYKVKVLVYSGDQLVAQTNLKQCKYAARTWKK